MTVLKCDPLIRSINPFAETLASSTCIFQFDYKIAEFEALEKRCKRLFNRYSLTKREKSYELCVSHDEIDAFGGLLLLSQEIPVRDFCTAEQFNERHGTHGDYGWSQLSMRTSGVRKTARSITQRFAELLFTSSEADVISLVVSLDDLNSLTEKDILGNSLAVAPIESSRMATLLNRQDWNGYLERYRRSVKRAVSKGRFHSKPEKESPYLISSCGDISKLSWCSRFHPFKFAMIPTPIDPSTINIVIWSMNDIQVATVCGDRSKKEFSLAEDTAKAWLESFK